MKHCLLLLVFVASLFAPQPSFTQQPESTKPTFAIDSNYPAIGSGAVVAFRKRVAGLGQYLQTDCGLGVTIRADKADYLIKLAYTEGYWVHKAVTMEIADPDGKTISTMNNTNFQKDYQHVCSIILADWTSRTAANK